MTQLIFGETPRERALYIMWAFNDDLNQCIRHCDKMIERGVTPSFYEEVKNELKR